MSRFVAIFPQERNSSSLIAGSDKYKVHDVIISSSQCRDFTQTYVAEPCNARRAERDVNTLLLQISHGTNDVIVPTVAPSVTAASEATPSDNEHEESYSDTDSDPYIFRDRQLRQTPSIGDVGDSGVDDVIVTSRRGTTENPNGAVVSKFSKPVGAVMQTGECSPISSGTGLYV